MVKLIVALLTCLAAVPVPSRNCHLPAWEPLLGRPLRSRPLQRKQIVTMLILYTLILGEQTTRCHGQEARLEPAAV